MKKDYDVFGLLEFLKKLGYALESDYPNSDVWESKSNSMLIAFSVQSKRNEKVGVHYNLNDKIVVDPVFNKLSQVPFVLDLPTKDQDFYDLQEIIAFCKTREGMEFSNGFCQIISYKEWQSRKNALVSQPKANSRSEKKPNSHFYARSIK